MKNGLENDKIYVLYTSVIQYKTNKDENTDKVDLNSLLFGKFLRLSGGLSNPL